MMTVHKFTGRYGLITKAIAGAMLALLAAQTQAAPAEHYSDALLESLAAAEGARADSLLQQPPGNAAYDEQIFTELSPILDSPQGIKLPEDQQLSD